MIAAACFLPHPPLLLAEYASLADPGADLRARCGRALERFTGLGLDRLVVLTGAPRTVPEIDTRAPLGLRVARELLAGTGPPVPVEVVVPVDAGRAEVAETAAMLRSAAEGRTGVLVMGDGSARRGEKAPGHLDDRVFPVDAAVVEALAAGDPAPLAALDAALAAELMITGRAAWQVLAAAVPGPADTADGHAEDPFGVLYHVALWTWG